MPRRWRRIGGFAGLALLATVAVGEDMPSAVGRISYSEVLQPGAAICSGVLVAADLVLTAAHCVRGAVADPAGLRFDAGWTDGHPAGRRRGRAVILAAEGVPPDLAGLAQDVALIRLDSAFLPAEATPLPLAAAAPGILVLHAFARTPPDAAPKHPAPAESAATDPAPAEAAPTDPARDHPAPAAAPNQPLRAESAPADPAREHPAPALPCAVLATRPGLLGLDCAVVSGNSGAPLLQRGGAGWHIAAIMVAASRIGPVRSWATLPPPPLLSHISLRAE